MAIYFNRDGHLQAIWHYRNVSTLQQHKICHWIILVYNGCSVKKLMFKELKYVNI